jgi:hypothetical protein
MAMTVESPDGQETLFLEQNAISILQGILASKVSISFLSAEIRPI